MQCRVIPKSLDSQRHFLKSSARMLVEVPSLRTRRKKPELHNSRCSLELCADLRLRGLRRSHDFCKRSLELARTPHRRNTSSDMPRDPPSSKLSIGKQQNNYNNIKQQYTHINKQQQTMDWQSANVRREDYTQAVSAIIERDFFPDPPRRKWKSHPRFSQSYIRKGIRRQGIGSFARNSYV